MRDTSPEPFFLCFGLPKSGTTFLQRMLNLHPQVSCPSEQSFTTLAARLNELLKVYDGTLKLLDRRTGGQGAPAIDQALGLDIYRSVILTLSRGFAKGKPIHGLNENSVIGAVRFYDQLFDHPRMIAIIRNPVDVAVSAWRHNRRLAREEPGAAATHLRLLDNPQGTLDGYASSVSAMFADTIGKYLDYAGMRANFRTVTYENLVADKRSELKRLFDFLGADTADATLETIVASSSREEMARTSQWPSFFGLDRSGDEEADVSWEVRKSILEACRPLLERLGYNVLDLALDHQALDH